MEAKSHRKYSWIPPRAREESARRHHCCCHLPATARRKAPFQDRSVDPAAFRQRAKIIHELLEDFGYSLDYRETCRCRESSVYGPRILGPLVQLLSGRYEDLRGLHSDLECPFDLLHSLFLKVESAHCWHRPVMAVPWLQDLLEQVNNRAFWRHRPQEVCASCRKRQAAGPEVGISDRKQKSHRQRSPSKRMQGRRPSLDSLSDWWSNIYQTAEMDLPRREAYELGEEEGGFASIQELKNSLMLDLEKHQLYLTHLESRLSSLETRAEDVTRHLEKANLELEAIKGASVPLQTVVDQRMSPVTEDLTDRDLQVLDSVLDSVIWSVYSLQTRGAQCDQTQQLPDLRRTGDSSPKLERSPRAAGSSREQRSDVEAGIFQCQDQINVLLQQISQQIDQTEMDLNMAINQACKG